MEKNRRTQLVLALIAIATLMNTVSAETEIINLKSDSTWSASSVITSTDWFKPEFDDSGWAKSTGRWTNNPCKKYCGKMNSCELTCIDWMWYDQSCTNCEVYFRKTISLPEEIVAASITMAADKYYWLYVNGNFVGSDTRKIGYTNAETYDITSYLRPGKNVIAIKAQSEGEYEGVALTGEIQYKTYNTLINQLQSEIDGLEVQLNSLSEDKSRLQSQVDTLMSNTKNLTAAKDYYSAETARLQVENLELKNTNRQLESSLSEAESSLQSYRVLNIVLILGILITLGILIATIYYFYNRMKGRSPRLSQPGKQMPTEKAKLEHEGGTHLSEKELKELTPMFKREKKSSLSHKWPK